MSEPPSCGERSSSTPLGRYELLFPIARGGMAEVFAVRLRGEGRFERYFALKRMHADLREDSQANLLFLDEARLTACIVSPYVVPVLDVGRDDDGIPFLVMELVVGTSLAVLRARHAQPFAPRLVAEIGLHAARGLDAAHRTSDARGTPLEIVHRDVSPQNLLVGVDGRVRVADFGIARARQRMAQHTRAGFVKGKFSYLAPEQLSGFADARTDVFALGVILWELATGRSLFRGKDMLETLDNVRSAPIPHISEVRSDFPVSLGDVVARALCRDSHRRWRSANELSDALFAELAQDELAVPVHPLARLARDAAGEMLDALDLAARDVDPLRKGSTRRGSPADRNRGSRAPSSGARRRVTVVEAWPDEPTTLVQTPTDRDHVARHGDTSRTERSAAVVARIAAQRAPTLLSLPSPLPLPPLPLAPTLIAPAGGAALARSARTLPAPSNAVSGAALVVPPDPFARAPSPKPPRWRGLSFKPAPLAVAVAVVLVLVLVLLCSPRSSDHGVDVRVLAHAGAPSSPPLREAGRPAASGVR